MTLSSSYEIYLHNLFHPATFFVLFCILLLASVAFAELLLFALLAAAITFLFHRLTPLHALPSTYAVLVTGSSSGVGEEVALRLASLGVKVFAGVRREADGYRLQVKARQWEANILPILLDVTNERHVSLAHTHIRATCEQKGWRLYALILNAGMGEYGPVEMISAARMRRQLEVNLVAPHLLTQTFLPLLRLTASPPRSLFVSSVSPFKSSTPLQPRVLFVSSIASGITVPGRGAYCASKYALESLVSAYRVELQAFGISVVSIRPGELYSKFHDNSKHLYAQLLKECTDRAATASQQPSHAATSTPTPPHPAPSSSPSSVVPPPLPLSVIHHYDRAYSLTRRRWRVVGTLDIAADAVEVALRTRWPLPRYDCGDDAAVLPILQLLPSKWMAFALGRHFYTNTTPADHHTEGADGSTTHSEGAVSSSRDGRMADRERREAASDEEKQTFISGAGSTAIEEGEADTRFSVDEIEAQGEPPGEHAE